MQQFGNTMPDGVWHAMNAGRLAAILALGTLAYVGIAFAHVQGFMPRTITPIVYAIAILFDFAASGALISIWLVNAGRRGGFVLAFAFALVGAFALLSFIVMPPFAAATVHGFDAGDSTWFYVFAHVSAAAGFLAYAAYGRKIPKRVTRRFALGVSATAVVFIALGMFGAFLPDGAPPTRGAFSVVLVAVFGLATLLVRALDRPTIVDRSVRLALIAFTLGLLVGVFDAGPDSLSFSCSRLLFLVAPGFVIVAALRSLAWSKQDIENLLSHATAESNTRAARIRALWEIASVHEPDDAVRLARMLEIATVAIQPDKPVLGTLSHLDRGTIVFDAVIWVGPDSEYARTVRRAIHPGAVIPLERSIQGLLYVDGVTHAWNDLAEAPIPGLIAGTLKTRAVIGSPLQIGRRTHFIVFSSPETMRETPFANDDIAYLDVVASMFSSSFAQLDHLERMRHQMEHDALTGLANRVHFRKAVRTHIAQGEPFAIVFLNLDAFRRVNEIHGQMVADEVLVEIAAELSSVRAGDLVARLNGDEFGVLMESIESVGELDIAMERYAERFKNAFNTGDRNGTRLLSIQASIGGALFPSQGSTAEDLLRGADIALDVAKERGGATQVIFENAMERIRAERRSASNDLANALANDEFRLMYQPTFQLASGLMVGAEALLRWDHPERGELMPAEFIPLAERNGQLGALSRWVLARVIRDLGPERALPAGFRCYFNLAAQDLEDFSFVGALSDAIGQRPHLANILGVEITETAAMKNVERSLNTLEILRHMGIRVAIDDFGTGYSSLSYLKRLSVDMVKIDRSFVAGLPSDEKDAALTETMIGICKRFRLVTLAEGIETEAQRTWLINRGCKLGQGFLFARPLEFAGLLARMPATAGVA